MSLFRPSTLTRGISFPPVQSMIARSAQGRGTVSDETALHNSAVWAALRVRADLISTMPIDVYRRVGSTNVNVPTPPILMSPDGEIDICEFMYSTQFDLDRIGNTFGIIASTDATGLPRVVELVDARKVTVQIRQGRIANYKISGTDYSPDRVWHERQYTMSGLPVGLSPVMYAAIVLGEYDTIGRFAVDWFANGTRPSAVLKNVNRTFDQDKADEMKAKFKASTATGDPLVVGADWDFNMMTADDAASTWIEAKRYDDVAVARFFNVPADVIDASVTSKGGDIVYANITQKNLALLITNLQGAITRRERALSRWLPAPRTVKLNTDVLLRMDPQTRASLLAAQVAARLRTNAEARGYDDLPPLGADQIAEFDAIYGSANPAPPVAAADAARGFELGGVNVRIDSPVHMPPMQITPEFRTLNEIVMPPQIEQPAPVVNVSVDVPETTIRLVDGDGD